jgi:hypothetical protein
MANYCITKYWVEGEKAFLDKLAALIGDGNNVKAILSGMGMPFSQLSFEEEGCPYWYGAKMMNGVLRFTEEAKWEQSQCLWNLQQEKNSGIVDIRYYSFVAESDFYSTNDGEGKHFPYRISVFCDKKPDTDLPYFYAVTEENTLLLRSREEMLSYFARQFGWRADSEEGLRCLAEKDGYFLAVEDITVVSGPLHLGINKMKFDFTRGEDGMIHVSIKE